MLRKLLTRLFGKRKPRASGGDDSEPTSSGPIHVTFRNGVTVAYPDESSASKALIESMSREEQLELLTKDPDEIAELAELAADLKLERPTVVRGDRRDVARST